MKKIWSDRRLFICVLGIIGSIFFPESAVYIATIVGTYMSIRAYTDKKTLDAKAKGVLSPEAIEEENNTIKELK